MARTSDPALAERRRRQIIDAALACVRRRGFHQASMQEICAQAGMSAGALYRYFPSKTHLIAAIAEDVQIRVEAILAQAEEGGDFFAALEDVARVMFDEIFAPGDGALVADVMAEAARDPELALRLHQISEQTSSRLARLIQDAVDAGAIPASIDPTRAATLVIGVIDGLGVRQTIAGDIAPAESHAAFRDFLARYFSREQATHVRAKTTAEEQAR